MPKGTPKNIIAKLNAAVMDALSGPTARARLADLGQEIFPADEQTPEALRALQKSEIEKWWPIIKAAGIKAEQCRTNHVLNRGEGRPMSAFLNNSRL